MQSKLTMIGMYNFDPTLFDNMLLPSGISSDTVRDEILMKSGEFEVLYPDIAFMKLAIGHWSKKHYRTFEKWLTALNIEYDPLYNYDRTEEYTDERQGSSAKSGETGRTFSNDSNENHIDNENAESNTNSVGNSTGHTTGSTSPAQTTNTRTTTVAAFDANTYQPKEQTTDALTLQVAGSDSSDTTSSTGNSENSKTSRNNATSNSRNENGSDDLKTNEVANNNEIITHKARLFGNIGVTTSQQMLQSELDIARFNLFEQIADLFVTEFCLMIY